LLIIALAISIKVSGQTNDSGINLSKNNEIWFDVYLHYYINDKLEYYGDAGFRTIINEQSWNRIYARPSIRHHINDHWELHAGLGLFYIFFNEDEFNRFELTPWQGIQLNWPKFGILGFKHLVKLEERISFLTEDWTSSYGFRFRYKLSGKLSLPKSESSSQWFIPFYGELFFPAFDKIEAFFSDKMRTGIGIGYSKSDWNIQLLYNWQLARVIPLDNFKYNDNAFQIKITKTWIKKMKQKSIDK